MRNDPVKSGPRREFHELFLAVVLLALLIASAL